MANELLWSDDRMRQVAFDRQSDFGVSAFWAAMDMAVQMRAEYQAKLDELTAELADANKSLQAIADFQQMMFGADGGDER